MATFTAAAQLLSTPAEKAVPAHQSGGALSLARGELVFAADGHTRAPVTLRVADIARRQQTRDSPKLRLVMADGAAFVFALRSTEAKDALLAALGSPPAPQAAPAVAAAAAAAAAGGAAPEGNLAAALARDGGAAARRGAQIGAAAASSSSSSLSSSSSSTSSLSSSSSSSAAASLLAAERAQAREREARALRAELRASDPEIAAKYAEFVLGRLVSEAEFWAAPRARAALEDAAQRRQRRGRDAVMVDDLRPVEQSAGRATFVVDRAFKEAVFAREPRVRDAFAEFVPLQMPEADFWRRYITAKRARAQRAAEVENGGGAAAIGAGVGGGGGGVGLAGSLAGFAGAGEGAKGPGAGARSDFGGASLSADLVKGLQVRF